MNKLADTSIHALQAIDPIAGMDMREALRIVNGKICLCGNLDCAVLETGTENEIFENTKNILTKCKKVGPFIFGSSNAVNINVKQECYLSMTNRSIYCSGSTLCFSIKYKNYICACRRMFFVYDRALSV